MGCASWRYSATRPSDVTPTESVASLRSERMRVDLIHPLPQALGDLARASAQLVIVGPREPALAHDELAVHENVAYVPRRHAEHPVTSQVLGRDRRRRVVIKDDQVGGRPGLDPSQERLTRRGGGQPPG